MVLSLHWWTPIPDPHFFFLPSRSHYVAVCLKSLAVWWLTCRSACLRPLVAYMHLGTIITLLLIVRLYYILRCLYEPPFPSLQIHSIFKVSSLEFEYHTTPKDCTDYVWSYTQTSESPSFFPFFAMPYLESTGQQSMAENSLWAP
jgi:hypothetical protein